MHWIAGSLDCWCTGFLHGVLVHWSINALEYAEVLTYSFTILRCCVYIASNKFALPGNTLQLAVDVLNSFKCPRVTLVCNRQQHLLSDNLKLN